MTHAHPTWQHVVIHYQYLDRTDILAQYELKDSLNIRTAATKLWSCNENKGYKFISKIHNRLSFFFWAEPWGYFWVVEFFFQGLHSQYWLRFQFGEFPQFKSASKTEEVDLTLIINTNKGKERHFVSIGVIGGIRHNDITVVLIVESRLLIYPE